MSLGQPVGQVRLTNVCFVKFKKSGKKFELACYKNKVKDWREGIEKDIDEVLQIDTIFTNVSKGEAAKNEDLMHVFGTDDKAFIARIILAEGELQVSEKERKRDLEKTFNEIATIVADKCINSETKRPFPILMIENSMREIHFSVHLKKSAKQQALEVIKLLKDVLPIERAQMRVRVSIPIKLAKQVKTALIKYIAELENEEWGIAYEMTICIDPGAYRHVEEILKQQTKAKGTLEILSMKKDVGGSVEIDRIDLDDPSGVNRQSPGGKLTPESRKRETPTSRSSPSVDSSSASSPSSSPSPTSDPSPIPATTPSTEITEKQTKKKGTKEGGKKKTPKDDTSEVKTEKTKTKPKKQVMGSTKQLKKVIGGKKNTKTKTTEGQAYGNIEFDWSGGMII